MISIVIPCYNAEQTIAATIASALEQNVEKEVIVVNDGSTDGSANIIHQFRDRIHLHSTPNMGVSSAREIGVKLARGDYIQYLDSDDLLAPATLRARVDVLEELHADVAHTDWQKFERRDDGDHVLGEIMRPNLAAIDRDIEAAAATSEFWAPPAALLYRKDIVDRIGGWHMALPIIQDARYLFEAVRHKARFAYIPGVGAYYGVLYDSLSRRNLRHFISDCSRNSTEIEAQWRMQGPLRPSRVDALTRMWEHVVKSSLLNGFEEFENARARYNSVATRRSLFEVGNFLRLTIGAKATASLLQAALISKRRLLRRAIADAGQGKPQLDRIDHLRSGMQPDL